MFKIIIFIVLSQILLVMSISSRVYHKLTNTDVKGVLPALVTCRDNAPTGCLQDCDVQVGCNLVTHVLPNTCNLYYLFEKNICLTNYTQIPSNLNITLYIKARKSFGQKCQKSSECMAEYGLKCIKGKCGCIKSQ